MILPDDQNKVGGQQQRPELSNPRRWEFVPAGTLMLKSDRALKIQSVNIGQNELNLRPSCSGGGFL
jgi:hypothetical protein